MKYQLHWLKWTKQYRGSRVKVPKETCFIYKHLAYHIIIAVATTEKHFPEISVNIAY